MDVGVGVGVGGVWVWVGEAVMWFFRLCRMKSVMDERKHIRNWKSWER